MILRWLMASAHLLVLPLGLAALWGRQRELRGTRGAVDLPRLFLADNIWGLSALLWIGTGLMRLLGGLEKPTAYYLHDRMFYLKMALLVLVLLLEIWPMVTLIRWRMLLRRDPALHVTAAPGLARICVVQTVVVALMVLAATAMARGYFY